MCCSLVVLTDLDDIDQPLWLILLLVIACSPKYIFPKIASQYTSAHYNPFLFGDLSRGIFHRSLSCPPERYIGDSSTCRWELVPTVAQYVNVISTFMFIHNV